MSTQSAEINVSCSFICINLLTFILLSVSGCMGFFLNTASNICNIKGIFLAKCLIILSDSNSNVLNSKCS